MISFPRLRDTSHQTHFKVIKLDTSPFPRLRHSRVIKWMSLPGERAGLMAIVTKDQSLPVAMLLSWAQTHLCPLHVVPMRLGVGDKGNQYSHETMWPAVRWGMNCLNPFGRLTSFLLNV